MDLLTPHARREAKKLTRTDVGRRLEERDAVHRDAQREELPVPVMR
jgi:hypothetical protein